ncbi:DUF3445 domain-containing protein [Pseudoroseicyclus sp. CXY001]|uniref:heme-dependent oxidative N-demethylase family protein n=1 Tax=Pseudoroseicyclus sp. CXY001 TaxID=3242492 RepID=UPI003570BA4B
MHDFDQPAPILLDSLPPEQLEAARDPLPRLRRIEGRWLWPDACFDAQMALKERLLAERPELVLGALPGREAAIDEALAVVGAETGLAPEGTPLQRLVRITQADICLLEEVEGEHVLVAAALAFPSGWTLAEKLGRTMARIHVPVPPYDQGVNLRVERMFTNLRAGQIVWRANLNPHRDFRLHRPESEAMSRKARHPGGAQPYLRSERQTLMRLPQTGAILFSIHTAMVRNEAFPGA